MKMELKQRDRRGLEKHLTDNGICKFKDIKMVPDPYLRYNFSSSMKEKGETPAIVIDNGKYLLITSLQYILSNKSNWG